MSRGERGRIVSVYMTLHREYLNSDQDCRGDADGEQEVARNETLLLQSLWCDKLKARRKSLGTLMLGRYPSVLGAGPVTVVSIGIVQGMYEDRTCSRICFAGVEV